MEHGSTRRSGTFPSILLHPTCTPSSICPLSCKHLPPGYPVGLGSCARSLFCLQVSDPASGLGASVRVGDSRILNTWIVVQKKEFMAFSPTDSLQQVGDTAGEGSEVPSTPQGPGQGSFLHRFKSGYKVLEKRKGGRFFCTCHGPSTRLSK